MRRLGSWRTWYLRNWNSSISRRNARGLFLLEAVMEDVEGEEGINNSAATVRLLLAEFNAAVASTLPKPISVKRSILFLKISSSSSSTSAQYLSMMTLVCSGVKSLSWRLEVRYWQVTMTSMTESNSTSVTKCSLFMSSSIPESSVTVLTLLKLASSTQTGSIATSAFWLGSRLLFEDFVTMTMIGTLLFNL